MAKDVPWKKLFEAAQRAHDNAYAPYSKFRVGAAVLTSDGTIHGGCNVENSSYGLTLCAERSAIAQAVAQGHRKIAAVAIVADTDEPCPPCGICRQAIAELAAPTAPVRSKNPRGAEKRYDVKGLLPDAFTKSYL
jgi:cytidine deaminase